MRAIVVPVANRNQDAGRFPRFQDCHHLDVPGSAGMAEGSRVCALILAKDLGYGDTQKLAATLEEVSRLLGAYTAAILASGS
jgi:hypothetical protein